MFIFWVIACIWDISAKFVRLENFSHAVRMHNVGYLRMTFATRFILFSFEEKMGSSLK
jgi:hypothetical protein